VLILTTRKTCCPDLDHTGEEFNYRKKTKSESFNKVKPKDHQTSRETHDFGKEREKERESLTCQIVY
jgi:hypothetical protein